MCALIYYIKVCVGGSVGSLLDFFEADEFAEAQTMGVAAAVDFLPTEKLTPDSQTVGFPASLPMEMAIGLAPEADIFAVYGISPVQAVRLKEVPAFAEALKHAKEMVKKDGASFRVRARIQSEHLLDKTWALIHDPKTPPSVATDLIKTTVKWAGLDVAEKQHEQPVFPMQININL